LDNYFRQNPLFPPMPKDGDYFARADGWIYIYVGEFNQWKKYKEISELLGSNYGASGSKPDDLIKAIIKESLSNGKD
jgi:hypothetical protein